MSRGDKVVILVDAGAEEAREFAMVADKNGRRIDVRQGRGEERSFIMVDLVTRRGNPLLTWRFMATRIIALIEERVEDDEPEPPETDQFQFNARDYGEHAVPAEPPAFPPADWTLGDEELTDDEVATVADEDAPVRSGREVFPAPYMDVSEPSDHGIDDADAMMVAFAMDDEPVEPL
jgi:hypothetical protein